MFSASGMDFSPLIAGDRAVITSSQCAVGAHYVLFGPVWCQERWSDGKNLWQVAHVRKYDCGVYG